MAVAILFFLTGWQEGYIRKTKSLPLRGPLAVHKATGGYGFPDVTLLPFTSKNKERTLRQGHGREAKD